MNNLVVRKSAKLRDALKVIDGGAKRIAVVVDSNDRVIGTLSDGDVRRAILKGKKLEDSIEGLYQRDPITVPVGTSKEKIIRLCTANKVYQIPVVNDKGRIVNIVELDELIKPRRYDNLVVLMAGGLGTRLRPLTEETPKPMLRVGGKPILQTIVEQFASCGFHNFVMCLNYKAEIIEEYFGDGRHFGVNIRYIHEPKRMGTAGALSLFPQKPEEPFFVMNGDLLTNVDFESFLEFHHETGAMASMCVREYDFQVPFGVVELDGNVIKSIKEKPIQRFFVNAGIYLLDPECLDHIPKNTFYDMPTLFETLTRTGKKTVSFPLREYWLDIGRIEEYERANLEYGEIF